MSRELKAQDVPVKKEHQGDALRLRIGDADRTVKGVHTYEIRYRVVGMLDAYDGYQQKVRRRIAVVRLTPTTP